MEEKLHNFSDEHVRLIRETVGKDAANEAEFQRFLYRAWKLNLDPLDGTIHLTARSRRVYDPAAKADRWEKTNTLIIGIDGFRAVADKAGKLAGISRGLLHDKDGRLVGAWAEVYRPDWEKPARNEVLLREYAQTKDGKPSGLWATMPAAMCMKCAEAGAHRMANPALFAGIYSPEEMMQADNELPSSKVPVTGELKAGCGTPSKLSVPEPPMAPPEPPKGESEEPSAEPPTRVPETDNTSAEEEFHGEMIAMEDTRRVKSYFELHAFDPLMNVQYLLRGKKIPEDVKAKDLIAVEGPIKEIGGEKVIKPTQVLKLGEPAASAKAPVGEAPAEASPGEAPVETPDRYTVTITDIVRSGNRTFSDGPPNEPITWARADLGGKPVYLCARGEFQSLLKPLQKGQTVIVTGEIESGKETFLHLKGVESTSSAA